MLSVFIPSKLNLYSSVTIQSSSLSAILTSNPSLSLISLKVSLISLLFSRLIKPFTSQLAPLSSVAGGPHYLPTLYWHHDTTCGLNLLLGVPILPFLIPVLLLYQFSTIVHSPCPKAPNLFISVSQYTHITIYTRDHSPQRKETAQQIEGTWVHDGLVYGAVKFCYRICSIGIQLSECRQSLFNITSFQGEQNSELICL